MTREDLHARLEGVFQNVFDDKKIRISDETTADDIEAWDSLEHISLIAAVEKAFKMRFTMREVSSMKNVGEMMNIIAERTKLK